MRFLKFVGLSIAIPCMYAQQVPMDSYQELLKSTFGLPWDMRTEIARQSGGVISSHQDKMLMYKPIGSLEQSKVQAGAQILPTLPLQFQIQVQRLGSMRDFYDGPNQKCIEITAYNIPASYEMYDISSGKAVISLVDMVSHVLKGEMVLQDFEVSAVGIAPNKENIIAYAGIEESASNKQKSSIYWADVKNNTHTLVGIVDNSVQRLQFCTDKILYVLAQKKLYFFDVTTPGKAGIAQDVKDAQGNPIDIEDFVINKMYPDLALAVMAQGLYLLDLKTKKFKLLQLLPSATIQRVAFFDIYIAILLKGPTKTEYQFAELVQVRSPEK